jgi:hypothetical protein
MGPRLSCLTDAAAALRDLRGNSEATVVGPPTLHQMLGHLAQSIDCSRTGYPEMKPAWVRATVGRLVLWLFLRRGAMRHDLAAPVPGMPAIAPEGDLEAAWDRLLGAIAAFQRHEGPMQPHFVYGELDKATYDRVHAMHIADHLAAVAA